MVWKTRRINLLGLLFRIKKLPWLLASGPVYFGLGDNGFQRECG